MLLSMKSILLNQEKTIKQKLFGGVFLLCSILVFISGASYFLVLFFILIGLFFFGFNMKIKIENPFENSERQFCVFNFKIVSSKLNFPYPDYISVFSTTLKGSNEYGAISAMGSTSKHDKIVLKLFSDNKNISIYSGESYEEALNRAHFIKDILNIDLYNPIAENE